MGEFTIYGPRSNLTNGLLKIVYDAIKKKKNCI